jgi:hypothetical protein
MPFRPQFFAGRRCLEYAAVLALSLTVVVLLLSICPYSARAADVPHEIDARTQGGLVEGTRIIRVTTLADDGPGSLRAALTAAGPRVVVFEVSGYLDLQSRIDILSPHLTVAGQTAPDPGIVIRGAGLALRTRDVSMEHIAVYPGAGPLGTDPRAVDALALISRADRGHEVRRVVLRNLTLAHATDENLSLAGNAIGQVRVESSLLAKGLRAAGHPRVIHSMGLLIYPDVRDVSVVGNIFANNDRRNPVINPGVEVLVANNLIFGYGRNSIHVHGGTSRGRSRLDLRSSIVGNVIMPTPDSSCGIAPVQVPPGVFQVAPSATLYLSDNLFDPRYATDHRCQTDPGLHRLTISRLAAASPVLDPDWTIRPASEVRSFVLMHAGMRPARRHPADAAIVRGVENGEGRMIDRAEDDGGFPFASGATRRLELPVSDTPSGQELRWLAEWLCVQHFVVGGAPNGDCRTR